MMAFGSGGSFGDSVDSFELAIRDAQKTIKVSMGGGVRATEN